MTQTDAYLLWHRHSNNADLLWHRLTLVYYDTDTAITLIYYDTDTAITLIYYDTDWRLFIMTQTVCLCHNKKAVFWTFYVLGWCFSVIWEFSVSVLISVFIVAVWAASTLSQPWPAGGGGLIAAPIRQRCAAGDGVDPRRVVQDGVGSLLQRERAGQERRGGRHHQLPAGCARWAEFRSCVEVEVAVLGSVS